MVGMVVLMEVTRGISRILIRVPRAKSKLLGKV